MSQGSTNVSEKKTILKITKGKEYRAKIDKIFQDDIFFADAYRQARDCLFEILQVMQTAKIDITNEYGKSYIWDLPDVTLNGALRGRLNNIIAFCADRGQGKTSAMRSFSRELQNRQDKSYASKKDENEANAFWQQTGQFKNVEIPQMCFIGNIDPSTMSTGESILQIILSRMFNEFNQYVKNDARQDRKLYNNTYNQNKLELIQQFTNCFHSAEVLKNKADNDIDEDNLDRISELGDSSNLLAAIYKLVRQYLSFFDLKENACLVIQIDDADMNFESTYRMLEDIRKYLLIPNVIMLIATNMEQLENTIEQHFINGYQQSLKHNESMVDVEYCHQVAELYLEKAIPNTRRIFLPTLMSRRTELWIRYKDPDLVKDESNKEESNILKLPQNYNSKKPWMYQDQLLSLLHQKTGMIFYNSNNYLHNILPNNIRELTHFLAYFNSMSDLECCYDFAASPQNESYHSFLKLWRSNLKQFRHYLLDLWSTSNLRTSSRQFLDELTRTVEFDRFNYVVVNMPNYYSHERVEAGKINNVYVKNESDYYEEFVRECKQRGVDVDRYEVGKNKSNISASYSDAMTVLDIMIDFPDANRQYKFAYAIRLYFSIYFHLKLIEYLLKPSSETRRPFEFLLGDVLFKNEKQNDIWHSFQYFNVTLESNLILKLIKDEKYPFTTTAIFLRMKYGMEYQNFFDSIYTYQKASQVSGQKWVYNATINRPQTMLGFYRENNLHYMYMSSKTVFSPFFPIYETFNDFLNRFDEPNYYPSLNQNLNTGEIIASDVLSSFIILLNWDAQHKLEKSISGSIYSQTGLYDMINELYDSKEMEGFYGEILKINRHIFRKDISLFNHDIREKWPFNFSVTSSSNSRYASVKDILNEIQVKCDGLRIYFNINNINYKCNLILEDLSKIDENKRNFTIAELKEEENINKNEDTLNSIITNIMHLQIDLIDHEYEELIKDFIKQHDEKNDDANKSREEFVNQDINLLKSFLSKNKNEISKLTINNCIRAVKILKLYVPQNIPQKETSDNLSDQVNQKSEELESAVRTVLEKIIVGILKDSSLYKSSSSDQ